MVDGVSELSHLEQAFSAATATTYHTTESEITESENALIAASHCRFVAVSSAQVWGIFFTADGWRFPSGRCTEWLFHLGA